MQKTQGFLDSVSPYQRSLFDISQIEKDRMVGKLIVCRNKQTGQIIQFWAFPETAQQKSLRRLKRKIKAIQNKEIYAFITLTFNDESLDKLDSLKGVMRKFINKLRTYMRRNSDHRQVIRSFFDYLWKLEYGEREGRPHFHMLVSTFIPLEQLTKCWGMGFIQVQKIESKKMASIYLMKYMGKTVKLNNPKGTKRFGLSKGWNVKTKSEWEVLEIDQTDVEYSEKELEYFNDFIAPYWQDM